MKVLSLAMRDVHIGDDIRSDLAGGFSKVKTIQDIDHNGIPMIRLTLECGHTIEGTHGAAILARDTL